MFLLPLLRTLIHLEGATGDVASRTVPIYEEKWGLPTSPTTFRNEQIHSSTGLGRLQATAILGEKIGLGLCSGGERKHKFRAAILWELEVDEIVLR